MTFLYKYKDTISSFITYLKDNDYPAKEILTSDFIKSLGYILEYLDSQGLYCLVDNYNILVFTTGINDKTKKYITDNKTFIIKETTNEKEISIIDNYKVAIAYAFDFLEVPF